MEISFLSEKHIRCHGTTLMRCTQPLGYLAERGWNGSVRSIYEYPPDDAEVVVLHRVKLDEVTKSVMEYARNRGSILVYDTDDFIFSDEMFNSRVVRRRQAAMRLCDVILVSTDYLAEKAKPFGADIRVMRNGLSQDYLRKADRIFNTRSERVGAQKSVTIGYCSGSAHHDEDLSLIISPLTAVLDENPSVTLQLIGKISFPKQFRRFGERVVSMPFVPYDQFPHVYSEIDINIAPLRLDNALVQGRSEIKYMEAGACGVVTVASPSSAYRHAIRDGFNGMLAAESGEWREALQLLIDDAELRRQMGLNARDHVLEMYGPDKRAREWDRLLRDILSRYEHQKERRMSRSRSWMDLSRVFYFQKKRAFVRRMRRFVRNEDRFWNSAAISRR